MSDGWGDASGIEGNYEDSDDEAESGDTNEVNEPVEASSPTETPESNETSETSKTNETSKTDVTSETSNTSKTNETSKTNTTSKTKTNIKDEWNGRTIYIPDNILDNLEDAYLESQLKLRKADQDEFKKNRHFYPLLVQFGLEALSDADADEIQSRLSDIGDE